ncbi:hypothetical protein Scep_010115 [Stephania cephalantha]|uniref:Uncharacterized protein n=1 Tax=Stephania cephalantha TaxID=152367 RepID=A0AAP0JV79_9MAGN
MLVMLFVDEKKNKKKQKKKKCKEKSSREEEATDWRQSWGGEPHVRASHGSGRPSWAELGPIQGLKRLQSGVGCALQGVSEMF